MSQILNKATSLIGNLLQINKGNIKYVVKRIQLSYIYSSTKKNMKIKRIFDETNGRIRIYFENYAIDSSQTMQSQCHISTEIMHWLTMPTLYE